MATFIYPGSDLDRAHTLLAILGSFWETTYQGMDLVQNTVWSRAQLDAQAHLDLLDLVASISRFDVPVFHKENWHFLTFKQSEVNNFEAMLETYREGTPRVYEYGGLQYDVPPASTAFSVPCPVELKDCKVILNRITEPSLVWVKGIDFWLPKPGVVTFRQNPFQNALVARQEVFESNQVVDHLGGLWLYKGLWDWDTVYEQFGYAFKLRLASSEGYRELLNAVMDALVEGTKYRDFHRAWSAITGVPLTVENAETVETITRDARAEVIITDRHVYRYPLGTTPIVSEGQEVHAGDPLADTLQFFELGNGSLPADLTGLVMGSGVLATGYWGELTFENKTVLLVVETVAGRTKVSFEIGGHPGDVDKFWDDVHARGLARGQTLAQLLDQRTNPSSEPQVEHLPTTINPLEFLCQNLLRYHAFVVKIRAGMLGSSGLGMWSATSLRRIVPPESLMIILVELVYADEPIMMEGPGSETQPGYEEHVSGFPCMVASDVIDGPTMIVERVRAYQIQGKCE